MSRTFVYSMLTTHAPLTALVGNRVYQQNSLLSAQTTKPYLVYTFGNNTDEGMGDPDSFRPGRQFGQVYIHDEPGDYSRIDDIVVALKNAFLATPPSGNVCGIQYLETSRDLDDSTLESIMRYVRFQLATAR